MKSKANNKRKEYWVIPEGQSEILTYIYAYAMDEAYAIWGEIWQYYTDSPTGVEIIEA